MKASPEALVEVPSDAGSLPNHPDQLLAPVADISDSPLTSDKEESNDEVDCQFCTTESCWWDKIGGTLISFAEITFDDDQVVAGTISTSEVRYALYRQASSIINGPLGKGNRLRLPICVELGIKEAYPSENGQHVRFKDAKG